MTEFRIMLNVIVPLCYCFVLTFLVVCIKRYRQRLKGKNKSNMMNVKNTTNTATTANTTNTTNTATTANTANTSNVGNIQRGKLHDKHKFSVQYNTYISRL